MSDLVEFLLARIDELADAAREEIEYRKSLPDLTGAAVVIPPLMWVGWADPTFVLAECEAKRRIIGRHTQDARMGWDDVRCMSCPDEAWPCATIEALTLPYRAELR